MDVTEGIKKALLAAVKAAFPGVVLMLEDITLEHPAAEEHGDYSSNIAFGLSQKFSGAEKLRPQEAAGKIVQQVENGIKGIDRVETAGGFINFWLSPERLVREIGRIGERGAAYGTKGKNGKKTVIEIVSPNINKPLHIGHLRNAALGMSLARLYEAAGWAVIKDEINNDRGLHIMKATYGYLLFGQKRAAETKDWKELLAEWTRDQSKWSTPTEAHKKPDFFVGEFYVLGEKFLAENGELAEKQLSGMLRAWEAEEKDIWRLWRVMSAWVHEGIDATYKRIGVKHDKRWYEHRLYKEGRGIILAAVDKGLLEKLPDGAIQANLVPYGLDNKILIRRDGTAIYMTFDIALTKHKVEGFKADKYIWVVGSDQIDHFRRLFAIFALLGLGKIEDFYHLAYGMVRVPEGKMSSRLGNVILADDFLDKVKEMTAKFNPQTAEETAVGAVKYAMLKVNPRLEAVFDLEKSISLEGDSGPYLQYTYARARSVVRRSENSDVSAGRENHVPGPEELSILRFLYRFPEVVEEAARQYAPNLVCAYLFELAKRFNNFYNNVPILQSSVLGSRLSASGQSVIGQPVSETGKLKTGQPGTENRKLKTDNWIFRLALTRAVAQVLKNGLTLLGVPVLEQM